MKSNIKKKIVNRVFEIISESIDKKPDWRSNNPMEIKVYAMIKTGLEMSIPKEDVEHAVECYRKSELN